MAIDHLSSHLLVKVYLKHKMDVSLVMDNNTLLNPPLMVHGTMSCGCSSNPSMIPRSINCEQFMEYESLPPIPYAITIHMIPYHSKRWAYGIGLRLIVVV